MPTTTLQSTHAEHNHSGTHLLCSPLLADTERETSLCLLAVLPVSITSHPPQTYIGAVFRSFSLSPQLVQPAGRGQGRGRQGRESRSGRGEASPSPTSLSLRCLPVLPTFALVGRRRRASKQGVHPRQTDCGCGRFSLFSAHQSHMMVTRPHSPTATLTLLRKETQSVTTYSTMSPEDCAPASDSSTGLTIRQNGITTHDLTPYLD